MTIRMIGGISQILKYFPKILFVYNYIYIILHENDPFYGTIGFTKDLFFVDM